MPACTVVGCRSHPSRQGVVEVVCLASLTLPVSTSRPLVLRLINLFVGIRVRTWYSPWGCGGPALKAWLGLHSGESSLVFCVCTSPVGASVSLDVSGLKFKLYHQGNNFLSFFLFSKMGVHCQYGAVCLRTACACESILSRCLTHSCQS